MSKYKTINRLDECDEKEINSLMQSRKNGNIDIIK